MGMFDTVRFTCPQCGGEIRMQSKGGPCILATFDAEDCHPGVAADLDDDVTCAGCNKRWRVRKPDYVEVRLIPYRPAVEE